MPLGGSISTLTTNSPLASFWRKVPGATGYNVMWGVRPDRLTLTYQVFADELGNGETGKQDLRALNVGVGYYAAVEAFNETGVSTRSKPVRVR